MKAQFWEKSKQRGLFLYAIFGTELEIDAYKKQQGEFLRMTEEVIPLLFSKQFWGYDAPIRFTSNRYHIEIRDLEDLFSHFWYYKQNLWQIIDHASSKDPRVEKIEPKWCLNRPKNEAYNSSVHLLPPELKKLLFDVLKQYGIEVAAHAALNESESLELISELEEEDDSNWKSAQSDMDWNRAVRDEMSSWGDGWQ